MTLCAGSVPTLQQPDVRLRQPYSTPSCAIFIRTYWKDLEWLALCLRSIARFCKGFSEVVVAVPSSSQAWLERDAPLEGVRLIYVPNCNDDYLGQQVTKLLADTLIDADLIAHVDADCIFTRETTASELVGSRRPRIVTRPIGELGRHYAWRGPTEDFLGFRVTLDYMQQPPFVYPRWLYPQLRRHCLSTHGVMIEQYVMQRPPRGFSEFNVLGAWAHRHTSEHFEFVSVGEASDPCCDWHWSWGGLTPELRRRIEVGLTRSIARGPDATSIETPCVVRSNDAGASAGSRQP